MLKEEVLKLLESNRDKFISGQLLASKLNVSRAAVNKAVDSLRGEGHHINGATKKGYMLEKSSDILSKEGIAVHLAGRCPVGSITVLESVDSTNTYAKSVAVRGAGDGDVIIANSQSGGRGRLGREFYSPCDSGIYMSIILKPKIVLSQATFYTVCAAVAVCNAIYAVAGKQCTIKWVNDIFLDDKKICGILCEAVSDFESSMVESIIVGIGVNVKTDSFPKEISDIASSINQQGVSRNRLAAEIIVQLINISEKMDRKTVIKQYKKLSNVIGKNISYTKDKKLCKGYALDINSDGNLIVKNASNTLDILKAGEISIGSKNLRKDI